MASLHRRLLLDRVFTLVVLVASFIVLAPMIHLLATVAVMGGRTLLEAGFSFLYKLPPSPESASLGGIGPALLGSMILMVLSSLLGLPLAFFTAALAVEFPGSRLSRLVSGLCRALTGIPTILVGVLVYTLVVVPMGRFSALAGALALAIVMLPYSYTYMEMALSSVPKSYREAAYSLGLTRMRALIHVFAGIARRGLLAGVLVGLAKACGETAPLLFTIGGLRHSLFTGITGPIDAVPLLAYSFAMTPYEVYHKVAWGACLVLLLIYLLIFVAARMIVGRVRM